MLLITDSPISTAGMFLVGVTYIRSLLNLVNLISNTSWIVKTNKVFKRKSGYEPTENFLICIPMLREQRLISNTLNYFSQLNYPLKKYKIIVVTTAKEVYDKKKNFTKLKDLSQAIEDGQNFNLIKEKYLGLLPLNVLKAIYNLHKLKKPDKILKKLKQVYLQIPTTFKLANRLAKQINSRVGKKLILVMNYPHEAGVMGHQINYVVRELNKNNQCKNSIFAVYNADSRPNLNTLKYVSQTIVDYESKTGIKPNIVQQSSLFTLNYNEYPKTVTGYILRSASLFQTKWTLVRELARFRSQSEHVIKSKNNIISKFIHTKISHCVGHGLFVRMKLLAKEYLPTETISEDLPFGYYQCCKGEPILPLPILENSETPNTITGLINQKRVWFTPYLQYLNCRRRILNLKTHRDRLEVEMLTSQAEFDGFVWLVQSFVLFVPLLIGMYFRNIVLIFLWVGGISLYWFIPIVIIYIKLDRLEIIAGKQRTQRSISDFLLTSLSGLFILLTHSVGPMLCVKDFVYAHFLNTPIIKQKTER